MRRQIKIRSKCNVKKQTPTSSKLNASVQMNRPPVKEGPEYSSLSDTKQRFYDDAHRKNIDISI